MMAPRVLKSYEFAFQPAIVMSSSPGCLPLANERPHRRMQARAAAARAHVHARMTSARAQLLTVARATRFLSSVDDFYLTGNG